MSKASKKAYLEYYKSTDLKERSELVTNWKTIVEHEANLSKDLQEIYKEQPKELLHLAFKSFEEMDFMTKQKSLEEHKNLIEKNETKESTEKNLIIKAAHAKIDAAANEDIIAKGENNTQGKYKKFFSNMDNFIKVYSLFVNHKDNEKFENINVKTLVMTGEGDVGSTPEMSDNLSKKIKNSEVKIIPVGKHLCSIECSYDVNKAIKEHIQNA